MANATQVAPVTTPLVQIVDNQAITTSVDIAKVFGKRHDNVIQKIENLDFPNEVKYFGPLNFKETTYHDEQDKVCKCYQLTRDGFTFLAMRFTGKRAIEFQIAYITAFNEMEAELSKQEALPANVTQEQLLLQIKECERPDLPEEIKHTLEYKAMEMALETRNIAEEYLYRLVRHYCINTCKELNENEAIQRIKSASVKSALMYKKLHWLDTYKLFAQMVRDSGQKIFDEVNQYN